jgi:hypothetical protein
MLLDPRTVRLSLLAAAHLPLELAQQTAQVRFIRELGCALMVPELPPRRISLVR